MKNLFVILLMLPAFIGMKAQQAPTSGVVSYQEVIKMDIKLEGDAAAFAHMLPKEMKSDMELYFNDGSTLYKNKAKEADASEMMEQGGGVHIRMDSPEQSVFTDLEKNEVIEKKEFMTRTFLIEGEASDMEWKLTGEQKMILDFPCQEATTIVDSSLVSAWFSPALPVSGGPGSYKGLPGLILEVNSNEGERVILAQNVNLREVEKGELAKPKKGKKVSKEEFDSIVEEKMKEMGGESSDGNVMMIKIHQ